MVSHGSGGSTSTTSSWFSAAYARAAACRSSYSSPSSSMVSGRKNRGRWVNCHGRPSKASSGRRGAMRSTATLADPNPSATPVTIFSAVQQPVKRDSS
jgi:hypothetical protein